MNICQTTDAKLTLYNITYLDEKSRIFGAFIRKVLVFAIFIFAFMFQIALLRQNYLRKDGAFIRNLKIR